jgi:ABC-type sulfate/molybdate transport systems ATPase subunit
VAEQALRRLGLSQLAHRPGCTLSGGQAKQVAVARALAASPTVLLLDEPTAGLDLQARDQFAQWLVAELQRRPVPTVLATHDVALARCVSTRCLNLEHGLQTPVAQRPTGRHLDEETQTRTRVIEHE